MAGESTVLREYLIKLGFQVNDADGKKFDLNLAKWDRAATRLSKSLLGVASAATVAATEFAYRMEKLYFSSKLAETAASNLAAVNFAGTKSGIKDMTAAVQSFARSIRTNPGLRGFVEGLGVKTAGREMADVLQDVIDVWAKMPFAISSRQANMFGIGPDDLLLMIQGREEMRRNVALRKQMAADMGVDVDKAAESSHELLNEWRNITAQVGLFKDAIIIQALPQLRELAGVTKQVLNDWSAIVQGKKAPEGVGHDLAVGLGLSSPGGGVELTEEARRRIAGQGADSDEVRRRLNSPLGRLFPDYARQMGNRKPGTQTPEEAGVEAPRAPKKGTSRYDLLPGWLNDFIDWNWGPGADKPGAPAAPSAQQAAPATLLSELERKYALPAGTLDAIWAKESARGNPKYMRSAKGAEGHFGFMPETQKQYGLRNPNDFAESAGAAARKMSDLLRKYGGSLLLAEAAYNAGDAKVDAAVAAARRSGLAGADLERGVLGVLPKETRDYVAKGLTSEQLGKGSQVNINQSNTFNIDGTASPQEVARRVAEELKATNADTVRQFGPRIQ